jgi:hypothetical protein
VPAAKQAGSSALRVDNFLRPFTQKHLLALLREHGELAAEHGFWMNSIKTHCYVRFHHAEAAAAAREALWGLVWPPQHGKSWVTLRARWVTLRARWVTLRARWVTLRARWVTLRDRWVTLRALWVTLRARWVTLRARWVTLRARCVTAAPPSREAQGARGRVRRAHQGAHHGAGADERAQRRAGVPQGPSAAGATPGAAMKKLRIVTLRFWHGATENGP